jgi:hypothetical protein
MTAAGSSGGIRPFRRLAHKVTLMTAVTLIWCVFTIAVMAGAFET